MLRFGVVDVRNKNVPAAFIRSRHALFLAAFFVLATLLPAATALAEDPPKIAVMPLRATRVSPEIVEILDDLLVVVVGEDSRYDVIGAKEIGAFLQSEGMKELLGCGEVTCATEIGGALDATFTLTGSVGKLGDSVIISLSLFDNATIRVVKRTKQTIKNDENLYEYAINKVVADVFGRTPPPLPTQPTPVTPATSAPSDAPFVQRPSTGTLHTTSSPQGVPVFVKGRLLGETPLTVELAPGIYLLEYRKPGYAVRRIAGVSVKLGQRTSRLGVTILKAEEASKRRSRSRAAKIGGIVGGGVLMIAGGWLGYKEIQGLSAEPPTGSQGKATIYVLISATGMGILGSSMSTKVPPRAEVVPQSSPSAAFSPTRGGGFFSATWLF